MHDRLAQYRVNDKLKKVRSVLGRNLMALDEGPEVDFLDGLYHRQLEKSTLVRNALALHHSYQVDRKEPKSQSKLKAMV